MIEDARGRTRKAEAFEYPDDLLYILKETKRNAALRRLLDMIFTMRGWLVLRTKIKLRA